MFKEQGYLTATKLAKCMPVEEKRILKCISMIKMLIQNSERDGLHGLRPHSSMEKGEFLHTLQISNSFRVAENNVSKFELACYSNITFLELKKLIAEQYTKQPGWPKDAPAPHPFSFKVIRCKDASVVKDINNGSTLAELKFKPNENLNIAASSMETDRKAPILNDELTDLNGRAIYIFTNLFKEFAVPDMSREGVPLAIGDEECARFVTGVTGEPCSTQDNRVVKIIGQYDTNKDGKLDLDDFLEFYKQNCYNNVSTIRRNLAKVNYRDDLKQAPKDGDDDNILQARKSIEDMPRYKLSSDQKSFDSLFRLLGLHSEVAKEASGLIKMLCTNKVLYQRVLKLTNDPEFSWDNIFDQKDTYKTMYALEIIDSLIQHEVELLDDSNEDD